MIAREAKAKESAFQEHVARSHQAPLHSRVVEKTPDVDKELVQRNADAIRKQAGSHKKRMHEQRVRAGHDRHLAKLVAQRKHIALTISQMQAKDKRLAKEIESLTDTSGNPSPPSV